MRMSFGPSVHKLQIEYTHHYNHRTYTPLTVNVGMALQRIFALPGERRSK